MRNYIDLYARHYGITWDHKKFEVHHIDGNRENNDILNLILLPKELHQRLHTSGWFDLGRYESQTLECGMSDQDVRELKARIEAVDACRRWAALRVAGYRWPSGQSMGKITEDTAL